jgi:NAD(P)-dependent dehydrogenase (short-subunit alcohol dehydrogenase family)
MIDAGFGRIVGVSSPMAAAPEAGMSAYGVGKAALETLFAALAQEVAGSGVTVNVVRVRAIDDSAGADGSDKPHATTPSEISAAIRYLFSDAARVVNGEAIGLHGGR